MTYVPNPGFGVTLESLTPSSLTGARFATDINALLKYQEAAWLNTQIHLTADKTTIGEIQFAIWTLFTPSAINQTGINVASVNNWLGQAALINPSLFDFSSIRIYTPTGPYASNQEFISGDVAPVPEPGTMALLGFGMFGLAIFGKRRMNKES
ncbi:MAG: PEP-CTERM sorting domain-containing protein [Desulfuromonadales bacterium]|nr:PEP-CTERM sorting domain-containing protein [Desulfuromonadales bacterium]